MRLALALGFGGMLLLIAVAGVHSIRVLESINADTAALGQVFIEKSRALENIRSAFYLYGAEIRLLLDTEDPVRIKPRLDALKQLRELIDQSIARYRFTVSEEERPALDELKRSIAAYLASMDQAFQSRELAGQRLRIVEITDKISDMNEARLRAASQRSSQLMAETRNRVILMLGGTASFGILLAFSVTTYILRLERILRDRYQQIERVQDELHQLSEKLVKAQEEERRSIARELHDQIGQSMSALLVDLGNAAAIAPEDNAQLKERLESAKKIAESSVNAVRNLALLLRPSMLDDFGLAPALNWQAREVSRRTAMRVDVSAENLPDVLPDEHRTCVYRIVQEALHNAARHAQATAVRVSLRIEPGELVMAVEDNGRGFDPANTRGLGLLGMEERVRNMRGVFAIESAPGKGTAIRVRLPLADIAP
jgi:signal transduction histidine kinase